MIQIQFERSGGFAGIRQSHSISSDTLSPEEENKIIGLIETAHFFDLPPVLRSTQPGADRFQYKISVQSEQRQHTVQVDEAAVPAELQPFLAWLKIAARKP